MLYIIHTARIAIYIYIFVFIAYTRTDIYYYNDRRTRLVPLCIYTYIVCVYNNMMSYTPRSPVREKNNNSTHYSTLTRGVRVLFEKPFVQHQCSVVDTIL